jgi:hypothetical protein
MSDHAISIAKRVASAYLQKSESTQKLAGTMQHRAEITFSRRTVTISFLDYAIELDMSDSDLKKLATRGKVSAGIHLYFGEYGFSDSRKAKMELQGDSLFIEWDKGSEEDAVEIESVRPEDLQKLSEGQTLTKTLWLLVGDNLDLLVN